MPLATDPRAIRAITDFGAQQKATELTALLEFLASLKIDSVLEIGCWTGGTLWLWTQIADKVVSIDVAAHGDRRELPASVHRILGDSHDPTVKAQLAGQRFDLVFIDGDHTYDGVRRDWEMYAPLGRYVALHDIVWHPPISGIHVQPFWDELKARHDTVEFIDPNPCPLSRQTTDDAGIGVVLL